MRYVDLALAAFWVVVLYRIVLLWWPWDWKGNRKEIKLTRGRRDWEDDD